MEKEEAKERRKGVSNRERTEKEKQRNKASVEDVHTLLGSVFTQTTSTSAVGTCA